MSTFLGISVSTTIFGIFWFLEIRIEEVNRVPRKAKDIESN